MLYLADDTAIVINLGFGLSKRDRALGEPDFKFDLKFSFKHSKPEHPERAAFSFYPSPQMRPPPYCATRILRNLRNEAILGAGGLAKQTRPASRLRTIESSTGLFIIQVRGGLNDSAVTKLHIDVKNGEVSFEWKELFKHFFREKSFIAAVPETRPVPFPFLFYYHRTDSTQISNSTADEKSLGSVEKRATVENRQTMIFPWAYNGIAQLKPSLQALAKSDKDRWCQFRREDNEFGQRLQELRNPVQTWTDIGAGNPRDAKLSLQSCRSRRKADQEIDIDDEGAVNQARIDWEVEGKQVADVVRSETWNKTIMVCSNRRDSPVGRLTIQDCDCCREMDITCDSRSPNPCNSCISHSTECEWSLAVFNGWNNSVPPAMWGSNTVGNHALQDYQMQLMLLEQQKKKRLLLAQSSEAAHRAAQISTSANNA